jgi:hypothetical protein
MKFCRGKERATLRRRVADRSDGPGMTTTVSIGERLRFQSIDAEVCATLRELRPLLPEIMPGLLDQFYGHMSGWPEFDRLRCG